MRGGVFAEPPVLCGHRGMGRGVVDGHAENTLDSFLAAVGCGLSWVEVDVRTTADDVLIAAHFPTVPDGRFFTELDYDRCDGALRLRDLLDALPEHVGVDLDIKSSAEDALRKRDATTAAAVGRLAAGEVRRRPLLMTSFDPSAVLIAKEVAPSAPAGLLTWVRFPMRKAIPAARHLGLQAVAVHVDSFAVNEADRAPVHRDAAWSVDLAHRAGLDVIAWCPALDDLSRFVDAGVDCLVVNDVPRSLVVFADLET
ncbi:MAG TPA: glycerophosphodiester phosphodiesterase [Mycobacteriales bacterium]|nr:glycerophosphodiester phosphodiesterase [Mycobacteriales bacterium]